MFKCSPHRPPPLLFHSHLRRAPVNAPPPWDGISFSIPFLLCPGWLQPKSTQQLHFRTGENTALENATWLITGFGAHISHPLDKIVTKTNPCPALNCANYKACQQRRRIRRGRVRISKAAIIHPLRNEMKSWRTMNTRR